MSKKKKQDDLSEDDLDFAKLYAEYARNKYAVLSGETYRGYQSLYKRRRHNDGNKLS